MSNLLKSKFFLGVMMVVAFAFVAVSSASAAYMHTVTLKQGSSGSQVMELQKTLGVGADGAFGPMTKAAVMSFQSANGLTADGVVGPMTGAKLAGGSMGGSYPAGCSSASGYSTTTGMSCASSGGSYPAGCTSTSGYSPTTGAKCSGGSTSSNGPLTGGAGDVSLSSVSTYSGEEVGENEEDVAVMAFEAEADDNSDVEVTSVKVEFFQSNTADSQDLTDYADSVSIWLNGDEVGRADASDFTENSDYYSKSISLDGAIVKAGDTEDFVVAVTGLNNLDSGDIDSDVWGVDLLNVRFEDAEGVVTTESGSASGADESGAFEKDFDFASFASAADAELKVSLNDDDEDTVNKAHVINVDATADTDNVEILSFTLEAEGDSDLLVTELPVLITTTEAAGTDFNDPDDVIINATLWMNGEEIASESLLTSDADGDTEVVTFDDLEIEISAGDTEEFMIKLDLQDLASVLDVNDTVMADLDATRVDLIEAEDESGEELLAADLTGTADGEASAVRDIGFNATLVSTSAVVSHVGDIAGSGAGDDDQGTFTITFDVEAFDGDVYIDGTSPVLAGGGTVTDINLVTTGTVALTSAILTSPSGATMTGVINADSRFKVAEGETERFTVTVVSTVSVDGLTHLELTDIVHALTDATGDTSYTFNMSDFKTADILLNAN